MLPRAAAPLAPSEGRGRCPFEFRCDSGCADMPSVGGHDLPAQNIFFWQRGLRTQAIKIARLIRVGFREDP